MKFEAKFKFFIYLKTKLFDLANFYYEKGYLKKAELIFKTFYFFNLYDENSLRNYGQILFKYKRLKKAKLIFKKLVKNNPKSSFDRYNLANIYYEQRNLKEAKIHFIKTVEMDPLLYDAYAKLSFIFKEEGLYKLSLSHINLALKQEPNNSIYNIFKVKIFIELNKLNYARLILNKILIKDCKLAIAYSLLSIIHLKEGEFDEAKSAIKKAINIDPNGHSYYLDLGNIYKLRNDLINAELYTKKSIKLKKDYSQAYSNLGNIFRIKKKYRKAKYFLKKAILLKPDFYQAYSNLGNIFLDQGFFKEAETNFRKSIRLNPNYANGYSNLGNLLKDFNQLNEAEIMLRKAITIEPNNEIYYSNLGIILHAKGNLISAKSYLEYALEINSNFAYAYLNLGTVLRDLGNLEYSKENIIKALKLNPNMAKAYFNLSLLEDYKDSYKYLYSNQITLNKSKYELVDIFFARANFSHKIKDYKSSLKFLKIANKYKSELVPSQIKAIQRKTKNLYKESNKIYSEELNYKDNLQNKFIFIVGMPRSGSSLMESILSMNKLVLSLGETNFIEESYEEFKAQNKVINKKSFERIYNEKIKLDKKKYHFVTDKMLSNYQYLGIIYKLIPNAKFIHCYRNPLDNILSIYRSNFERGLSFSTSISDTAKLYLDQDEIIYKYRKINNLEIYSQSYEKLVRNPGIEIRNLINWIGWEWDEKYLYPHLSKREILTYSSVQARKKINTKSIDSWKNYTELLKPAQKILLNSKSKYTKNF